MQGFVQDSVVDVIVDIGAGNFGYDIGGFVDSNVRGIGLGRVSTVMV